MGTLTRRALICAIAVVAGCDDEPPLPPRKPQKPPRPPAPPASASSASSAAEEQPNPPAAEPTATPSAAPSAETKDLDQRCPAAAPDAPRLSVKELKLTSKLEDKRPVDDLTAIKAGHEANAYLVVKNTDTIERCMLVRILIGGQQRAALTLKIGPSPAWRTWVHVSPGDNDAKKTLRIDVIDDQGNEHLSHRALIE